MRSGLRRPALYGKPVFHRRRRCICGLLFNSSAAIKRTAIAIAAMWKQTLVWTRSSPRRNNRVFLQTRHDKSRWDVVRLGWDADYNDASNFLDIFARIPQ